MVDSQRKMTDTQIEGRLLWLLVPSMFFVIYAMKMNPVISDLQKRVEQLEAKCCAENGGLDNE